MSSRKNLPWIGLSIYGASTLTSMAGMSIGAAIFFVLLLLAQDTRPALQAFWKELHANRASRFFLWASAALAAAIVLSWAVAWLHPIVRNNVPVRPALGSLGKLWYLVWPFVLALAWRMTPEERAPTVLRSWWWAFFLISWLAIPEFFWGWPRKQGNPDLPPYNHPVLLLGHHLSVASVWIFPFFVTLDGWLRRQWNRLIPSLVLATAVLLSLWVLIFLYSRMLWIALPIGLALWGLLALPKRIAIGAVSAIALAAVAATQLPAVQQRWNTGVGRGDRWDLWYTNWAIFQERPLTGVGFGNTMEVVRQHFLQFRPDSPSHFVGHAHNLYLDTATSSGVIGLMALLVWIAALTAVILQGRRAPHHSFATPIGLLCALVVFLLNGLTQVNLWEGKVFHQVAWIAGWALSWPLAKKR